MGNKLNNGRMENAPSWGIHKPTFNPAERAEDGGKWRTVIRNQSELSLGRRMSDKSSPHRFTEFEQDMKTKNK